MPTFAWHEYVLHFKHAHVDVGMAPELSRCPRHPADTFLVIRDAKRRGVRSHAKHENEGVRDVSILIKNTYIRQPISISQRISVDLPARKRDTCEAVRGDFT